MARNRKKQKQKQYQKKHKTLQLPLAEVLGVPLDERDHVVRDGAALLFRLWLLWLRLVDYAVRHVLLRQGVLGIKVKIMKGYDPEGNLGPRKRLPDSVTISDAAIDKVVLEPTSEQRDPVSVPVAAAPEPAYQQEAYAEAPVF